MRLILTRHGETDDNVYNIIQGHRDTKLNKIGEKQAYLLSERLKNENFDVVYSSDLSRAAHTAKEIMKYHRNIPIYFIKELRERYLGTLEGTKRFESKFPEEQIPGLETWEKSEIRAKNFLDEILIKHMNDKLLFVSHGGFGRSLISVIKKINYLDINSLSYLKNTSVSIYEIDKNRNYNELLFNCIKHLE